MPVLDIQRKTVGVVQELDDGVGRQKYTVVKTGVLYCKVCDMSVD